MKTKQIHIAEYFNIDPATLTRWKKPENKNYKKYIAMVYYYENVVKGGE